MLPLQREIFGEVSGTENLIKAAILMAAKTSQNLMPELCFSVKVQARGNVDAHYERAIFQS